MPTQHIGYVENDGTCREFYDINGKPTTDIGLLNRLGDGARNMAEGKRLRIMLYEETVEKESR